MNAAKREALFAELSRHISNPKTELKYRSRFQLLIAVILSAQATDVSVNRATRSLFRVAPTPEKMLGLGLTGIRSHIRTIGLFNSKAANILKTCELLLSIHNGRVPKTRAELEALPGVGRKTANVILNTAFGAATIAVDTHIFRVANRTRLAPGKTVLAVEKKLLQLTPAAYLKDAHHLLILHGRYTCKARAPNCGACCILNFCEYPKKVLSA